MVKNNKNQRGETLYKAHYKLFLCFLILNLIAISLISAASFDNTKDFDDKVGNYGSYEIRDWYGLRQLMRVDLRTNTQSCGINCNATKEIIMYQKEILIDDVNFLRLDGNGKWVVNPIGYQFYILDGGKKIPYTIGTKVDAGVYNVLLEGQKGLWDTVDWQIKIGGRYWTDEWAKWTSSLDEDIVFYYDFNNASGVIIEDLVQDDAISKHDGKIENITSNQYTNRTWVTGILNNATILYEEAETYINVSSYYMTSIPQSMCTWINFSSLDANRNIFGTGGYAAASQGLFFFTLTTGNVTMYSSDGITNTQGGWFNTRFYTNQWYHLCYTWDGLNVTDSFNFYINGSLLSTARIYDWVGNSTNFVFGSQTAAHGGFINATLDEAGFWEKELTATEVSDLYGDGTPPIFGDIAISLNSPVNNFKTANENIHFNCSGIGTNITNATLIIDSINNLTITNSSIGVLNLTINTSLGFAKGDYNWTCRFSEESGVQTNTTSVFYFNVSKFVILNESYVTTTTSGSTNEFLLQLETDGTQITTGYLNYNNTNFLGSISSSGNYFNLSRNQIAVGASTRTNVSFYWNVTMGDADNFTTTLKNQTVIPIVINGTCEADMYAIFNFTIVDENNKTKMDGAAQYSSIKVDLDLYTLDRTLLLNEFFQNFSLTNPIAVCIDNNLSGGEQYSLDAQIQYGAVNYSFEFYNIERYVLNETTLYNNITLYDLDTPRTQKFRLLARDTSYLPIDGALIQIERKYLEDGTFYITEIPKTNEKGITSASLQLNDVIYNFYIYQAGVLISSFPNVLAICQTPLVKSCEIDFNAFQTQIEIPNFEEGDDFSFTLDYDDTTKIITSQFEIPSGEPSIVFLEVIREDTLGTAVCSDTLTSASGTLNCVVPNSFGNSTVMAKLYKDGVEQGKGSIKTDQKPSDIFDVVLIMLSIFVILTLIGIGISDSPVITGAFIFIGLILMIGINLIESDGFYGKTATILFFAIAMILVIIKAARRS